MGYLFSSLCCIAGISGLSTQKTARLGNSMGIIGVLSGVITALCQLNLPTPVFVQAMALLGAASCIGTTIGYKVAVTELP